MGLNFDSNGKYFGWSNLFDYSSIENLNASEQLPMPQNIQYKVVNDQNAYTNYLKQSLSKTSNTNDIQILNNRLKHVSKVYNIDQWIEKIESANTQADKILLYAKMINAVNKLKYQDGDSKVVNISYTHPKGDEYVQKLTLHESTQMSPTFNQEINKNFITSHIAHVVQNPINCIRAYAPISMTDLRSAADNSPKQQISNKYTMLNPATKYLMQYTNMTGKNVIGIAANGCKSSFMWHYYLNDLIRNGNAEQRKLGQFEVTLKRVVGRASGHPVYTTITGLPDMNFKNVDIKVLEEFGYRLTGNLYVDLMISQVISAATDNAKELILAKINAGTKMASLYLYLITLGINANDLVAFMTSPVVEFIDTITQENAFNGTKISMNVAIQLAKGKFFNTKKGVSDKYNHFYTKLLGEFTLDRIAYIYKKYKLDTLENVIEDCNDLHTIVEGANEFNNLGRLLGLNQGLPTSKIELNKLVSFIEKIYSDRVNTVNKYKKANPNQVKYSNEVTIQELNVKRWLDDEKYRQTIAKEYNKIKASINIFDLFTKIPQFDSIRQLLSSVITVDENVSFKSKLFDDIVTGNPGLSEEYKENILQKIDDIFITNFIQNQNISIPVTENDQYFKLDKSLGTCQESGELYLNNMEDIASFKYIFENRIIPELKKGIITEIDDSGEVVQMTHPELSNNTFINYLVSSTENGVPIYKLALNMSTVKNSTDSQRKLQQFQVGLQELSKYQVGSHKLSDLFILYNLIVNKNKYGANKMTTVFDSFITTNQTLRLLNQYLKYLGELDYNGIPVNINSNDEQNTKQIKGGQQYIAVDYNKIMISAAPRVTFLSEYRNDPYVVLITDEGAKLYKKSVKYNYVQNLVQKKKSETDYQYQDRDYNNNNYFVLAQFTPDVLQDEIAQMFNFKDPDIALDAVRRLISDGYFTVSKYCQ